MIVKKIGKRRRILVAALLVIVLGGLAWVVMPSRPSEPVYEGKPVSYWLRQSSQPPMDSNAVPALERALATHDGPMRRAYIRFWSRMNYRIQNHLPEPVDAYRVRLNAGAALAELGNDARPAIPALIGVLKHDEADLVRSHVADALGKIGGNDRRVTDALAAAVKDPVPYVRLHAAYALGKIGMNEPTVTSALVEALKDKVKVVRDGAGEALKQIGPEAASKAGVK